MGLLKKILQSRSLNTRNVSLFTVTEEIRQALFEEKAVVALESTIITHGMKFPHNCETAKAVEYVIREQNAVPATIAVLNGKIKVGLSSLELEELSQNQERCLKISRRDFPYAISHKLSGGTTVSGTMIVAYKMGIPVFVTGGIGGVHREGEKTMDISADLTELGKTPVAVVSSGIKSILDIPKTLEYLETQGVAVATYGSSREFPAFYCRKSGHYCSYNLESAREAAELIQSAVDMNLGSGILIGVPIPEKYSLNEKVMESVIMEGLKEAKEKNVRGKDVTPFLLNQVSQITQGKSLESNIALIKNNAMVGGEIAVELSKLREKRGKSVNCSFVDFKGESVKSESEQGGEEKENFDVVVIGGTNLDFVVNIEDDSFKPKAVFFTCIDSRMIPTRFTETCVGDMFVVRNAGNIIPNARYYPDEVTTNEPAALELGCVMNDVRHIIVCGHSDCKMDGRTISGRISDSGGGVARNIAEALSKLRLNPRLISAVGDDRFGRFVLNNTASNLNTSGIMKSTENNTGACMVLCDHTGECLVVVGDMGIHGSLPTSHIRRHEREIAESSLVILDGNLSQEATEFVLRLCHDHSVPVWFEPTDFFRASKPFTNKDVPFPSFISPNFLEFRKIYETMRPGEDERDSSEIAECIEKGYLMAESIENIIITLGRKGVMVIRKGKATDPFFTIDGKPKIVRLNEPVSHRLYKPNLISKEEIVNVSGAGDCFASGFIAAMLKGENEESCIEFGFRCSTASLKSCKTVPEKF